jgi:hypothetical protein
MSRHGPVNIKLSINSDRFTSRFADPHECHRESRSVAACSVTDTGRPTAGALPVQLPPSLFQIRSNPRKQ